MKNLLQKTLSHLKRQKFLLFGALLLTLIALPQVGFCSVFGGTGEKEVGTLKEAFTGAKNQVVTLLGADSGLFWLLMFASLLGGLWALKKGSVAGIVSAMIVGLILANFTEIIDIVLKMNFLKKG